MLFNIIYVVWDPADNTLLTDSGENTFVWQADLFKAKHFETYYPASQLAMSYGKDVLEIKIAYEVTQVVNNAHLAHYRPKHQVISE